MAVSPDTINRIKAVPLSAILEKEGAYLKKVGREFVTHCLWHQDKNPSLTVSDDKGFVFCHVCLEHNDGIGYVTKKHGLNFREACERIASMQGFECLYVDEDSHANQEYKAKIEAEHEKVNNSQKTFRDNLLKYPEAIKFLQKRNILPETSKEFGIGYNSIQKRITVPIHNYMGKHVGFTARTILEDVKPKYINTENNAIFNKSEIVFNEHRAAQFIREADECLFVEGHLDVVALWQAGVKNAVALQGTASPSDSIVRRLIRKTRRFALCMDADAGGRIAVSKFLDSVKSYALSGEIDVKIVTLPDGSDPDEFIKEGGDIKDLISNAPSWLDWILDTWLEELDFNDKLKIQQVESQLKDLLSKIESPALKSHYFDKASVRLAQNRQSVAAEIAKSFRENQPKQSSRKTWHRPDSSHTRKVVERRMMRLYLHRPDFRFALEPLMPKLSTPSYSWLWERISELIPLCSEEVLVDCLKGVLAVAEPYYMQQLRPLLLPRFAFEDNELSIVHIEDTLCNDEQIEGIID